MHRSMLLEIINKTIQKYLDHDPDIVASLKQFNDQCVLLELTDVKKEFIVEIDQSTIVVSDYSTLDEKSIDTTISTNVINLLRLALGADYQSMLKNGSLHMEGDIELASQLRELFKDIDIDWEEIASKYVGDTVAYQLGSVSSRVKKYKQRSVENFRLDVSEYLQEEARFVPTKIELDKFLNDVDKLDADIERLEARTQRLMQEK